MQSYIICAWRTSWWPKLFEKTFVPPILRSLHMKFEFIQGTVVSKMMNRWTDDEWQDHWEVIQSDLFGLQTRFPSCDVSWKFQMVHKLIQTKEDNSLWEWPFLFTAIIMIPPVYKTYGPDQFKTKGDNSKELIKNLSHVARVTNLVHLMILESTNQSPKCLINYH